MQLSSTAIFATLLALRGVLAAPAANEIVQEDGITLKLVEGNTIQRLAADGTLLGKSPLPEGGLHEFNNLVGQSQSQRRNGNVLVQRQCLYGHPCAEDSTCWFNGCSGCLFVSQGVGGCV